MHIQDIQMLFDYGYGVNARLLNTAEQLTAAQFDEPVFAIGSVRSTLVHHLASDWLWRMRLQEGISLTSTMTDEELAPLLAIERLATLDAIRDYWQVEEAHMRAWLASLTDDDLKRTMHYQTFSQGAPWAQPLGPLLLHVHNHGAQHRSEVAAMLTQLGHSPGDLDLLLYLREKL